MVRMTGEIDHEVIAALIGGMAIVLAALTSGLFLYLSAKFRNGKHELEDRIDELTDDLNELDGIVNHRGEEGPHGPDS
jgi:hypothetical protein